MSNLCDQLQNNYRAEILKIRSDHESWVMNHEHLITHAVTLTFDIRHLWRTVNKHQIAVTLKDTAVIDLLHQSMKYFKWKLEKSLYGNKRGKIFFVPVIEGLSNGQNPHYHCFLGVSEDRLEVVEEKVKFIWSKTLFGGDQIVVKPYRNRGWVSYTMKSAAFLNRESIDWMNVLLPTRFTSTAE